VDECVEGILRFMHTEGFNGPLNIGSEEMITINDLTKMVIEISGKKLSIKNVPGPLGVKGRNSHNELIRKKLGWEPTMKLRDGMEKMYAWVLSQVEKSK
jgi:nucleoside-diphosphate-sugar epimerase